MNEMRFQRLACCAVVCFLAWSSVLVAQKRPREDWGAPAVTVTQDGGHWVIAGKTQKVTLDQSDLRMKVEAGTVVWAMGPSSKEDMLVKSEGEEFYVRLADAGKIDITPYDTGFMTGVKITLTRFRHNGMLHKGRTLDLTLYLTICLDGKAEELVMSAAANEREAAVRLLDWPRNWTRAMSTTRY